MRYLCELGSINTLFFCIFDVFMQSKTVNFSIYPIFGAHFGVHFVISFYPHSKSRLSDFLKRLFFLIFLEFELYQIHLHSHKFIGEMGIYSPYKAFRTIAHPSIYNVRSYVLHTSRRIRMAQIILRNRIVL